MSNERIDQAAEFLNAVQIAVLREKFASYGIVPQTAEQADQLLAQVDQVIEKAPLHSAEGQRAKTASAGILGKGEQKLAQDGYSEEAHRLVDDLMKHPEAALAMQIMLTAQTV
jgi:hypothetical protein